MDRKEHILMLLLAMIAGVIGGAVSSWIFMDQTAFAQKTSQISKVIKAEAFHLIDKDGSLRAALSLGAHVPHEPGLVFFDKNATHRIKLTLIPDGSPLLSLHDRTGGTRILLIMGVDDQPFLDLFAKDSGAHTALGVLSDGSSRLIMYDKDGCYFLRTVPHEPWCDQSPAVA